MLAQSRLERKAGEGIWLLNFYVLHWYKNENLQYVSILKVKYWLKHVLVGFGSSQW